MACVTLKRPLEWVDPSMNAEASGPSSPKAMMMDGSSAARSPKRLRMPGTASGSGSSMAQSSGSSTSNSTNSLFKPLTPADIREQIAGELRKLKIARRNFAGKTNKTDGDDSSTTAAVAGSKSPAHSDSSMGGCSPGRDDGIFGTGSDSLPSSSAMQSTISAYHQLLRRRRTNEFNNSNSVSSNAGDDSENKPLFSLNQVVLIVERLLREKEDDIRQEYDKILINRLAEQYEQFVKFTYDQIQRKFDSHSTPSYLS